jgi:oligosaccharide repeat unit polymerase
MLFLNPALLFSLIWTVVLALYSLKLSQLLEPIRGLTILLIVGCSATFIIGWLLESMICYRPLRTPRIDIGHIAEVLGSTRTRRRARIVLLIFLVGLAFEIAYFGAAPFLGLIGVGHEILYTDFGISGFHGLMNAMFYSVCCYHFARILLCRDPRLIKWLMIVSALYPVFVMSRQVLVSLLLQYLFIYLGVRRPSGLQYIRVLAVFIGIFLLFGYLGDLRSGREHIIQLAAPTFEYPDWVPSAFIWFYIYVCTPLNNVNANIDIAPNYLPLETAGSLIPSFARESFLQALGASSQWELVTESFNVSSLLQSMVSDFGIYGSFGFTLLCGLAFSVILRRSRHSPAAFFSLVVLLHGIALSFFANLLFHLVFLFQMLTVTFIVSRGRRQ